MQSSYSTLKIHEKYLIMNYYYDYFAVRSTRAIANVIILVLITQFSFYFDFKSINLSTESLLLSHLYYSFFLHCSSASIFPLLNEHNTYFLMMMSDFSILHSIFPSFFPILNSYRPHFSLFIAIYCIHYYNFYYSHACFLISFHNCLAHKEVIISLLLMSCFSFFLFLSLIIIKEFLTPFFYFILICKSIFS